MQVDFFCFWSRANFVFQGRSYIISRSKHRIPPQQTSQRDLGFRET